MSTPITELTISAWFRHIGTKLSNEDYEAGIEALHATLTRLHEAEAERDAWKAWFDSRPRSLGGTA